MSHIERRRQARAADPDAALLTVKEENNTLSPDCMVYVQPNYFGFLSKSNKELMALKIRKNPKLKLSSDLFEQMTTYAKNFAKNVETDESGVNWLEICDHMNEDFLTHVAVKNTPQHDTNVFRDLVKNADGNQVLYQDMFSEDIRQLDVWRPTLVSTDPSKYRECNKIPFRQTIGSKRNYERYADIDGDRGSLMYERKEQLPSKYDLSDLRAFQKR
jgi:hypothetical protein